MEIHDKKQLAAICIERLKKEYPLSDCTLDYEHAWQLLVEVRLAAQCTDARVNVVVQDLFAKYPNVAALAAAEPEEIEEIVRPCGLGRSKARDISACMRILKEKYDGKVPRTFDELLEAVKAFRAEEVTPMALGAKDGWHIGMIQNALAVRTEGADYMNRALQGEETFDTEGIVKSAELLCELNEAGAFPEGTLGLGAEEAQEEFYMGMVPMYYGGSWVASGCDSDENDIQGKIKAVPMPIQNIRIWLMNLLWALRNICLRRHTRLVTAFQPGKWMWMSQRSALL